MIEDDDDKLRRNLLVGSASILLLTFLEAPFLSYVGAVFKAGWEISPVRAWVTISAVLAYLALRYRFSPAHEALSGVLARKHNELVANRVPQVLNRVVMRAGRTNASTSQLGFELKDLKETQRLTSRNLGMVTVRSSATVAVVSTNGMQGTVELVITEAAVGSTFGGKESLYRTEYQLQPHTKRWVHAWSFFHSYLYSREATVFLVPAVLAALAAGLCAFKLTQALST